ncbi:hypothetical protein CPter291_2869 [Collimonas pratensis]|uniref:Uncharacterized protein n=1 Tax=Collimonas pratensis TaxID=279113 RepID=A0A127Q476_9BURK|nr:hypothetical protein CPter91_2475 [Collimonas pratensis]AMP15121.1 hypothetical protein CPter291_2869 [Collimonas pratensis]
MADPARIHVEGFDIDNVLLHRKQLQAAACGNLENGMKSARDYSAMQGR